MRIPVNRKDIKIMPDTKRVIARFFYNGEERALQILNNVNQLSDKEIFDLISPLLQEFSKRHRNISKIFNKNAEKLYKTLGKELAELQEMTLFKKLLIGAYFTHEYSIESAAFFNP
ncbi:glycosidase, partial [Pseudoxanthomonas sp. SGD-10]